jgi:hypothetical protein
MIFSENRFPPIARQDARKRAYGAEATQLLKQGLDCFACARNDDKLILTQLSAGAA